MIETNKLLRKDIYSVNETKTNKIWIDGKPIYRRVITDTISNIENELNLIPYDYVTDIKGWYDSGYGFRWKINSYTSEAGYRYTIYQSQSNNNLLFSRGSFVSANGKAKIIIEYTKTTD